jgi:hypothetical protein
MNMQKIQVKINAGICGFITMVEAQSSDGQMVQLKIISPCETIRKLNELIPEVDAFNEIGQGFNGAIYQVVQKTIIGCCSGYVVPSGIYKVMQVAAQLALPAPSTIEFLKKEEINP